MPPDPPHTMQCTEVWGGSAIVHRSVVMTGLDACVYSRPFEGSEEGGDIHYLSSCATGRITRCLIADVSGHGHVVAGIAGRLRNLMRRYMNYVNQSRLVEGINREFAGLAESGHFATAVVATFWGPTREIEITNAGHPTPLLYRAATKTWQPLGGGDQSMAAAAPTDIPLGIIDSTTYARTRTRLEKDDLLLFYSDAFIEVRGPDGRMLGVDGLVRTLQSLGPPSHESLMHQLLGALGAGEQGTPLADDTTLMLLRLNDLRPRASFLDGLRASARVGREFIRSLRPGGGPIPWPELSWHNLGGVWLERFSQRLPRD